MKSSNEPAVLALATKVHTVATLLVRSLRSNDRATGLTSAQRSVLARLIKHGPQTLSKLARDELVTPPTMTRLVQSLDRAGYIVRNVHQEDKRVSLIDYTSKAWTALMNEYYGKENLLVHRISGLTSRERELLEKVVPILEKLGTP